MWTNRVVVHITNKSPCSYFHQIIRFPLLRRPILVNIPLWTKWWASVLKKTPLFFDAAHSTHSKNIWLSNLVSTGIADVLDTNTFGSLTLHRDTEFISGFDFAVSLSSPECFLGSFRHQSRKIAFFFVFKHILQAYWWEELIFVGPKSTLTKTLITLWNCLPFWIEWEWMTTTIKSHCSRRIKTIQTQSCIPKKWSLILLNCVKLKFVSYTPNWLEQMYDIQKCTILHQKWILNPEDLLQNRSLETIPVCIELQYYTT